MYKIIIDSCGELTEELKADGHYESVPLEMEVNGHRIVDDATFDQQDFLKKVKESPVGPKSSCPSPEQIMEVERKVNEIISQHLPVTMEYISQEEARKLYDLGKLPQNASETLRIIRIGEYDACPCLGTHVGNTSEIGTFRISSTRYENGMFRIVFRLSNKE